MCMENKLGTIVEVLIRLASSRWGHYTTVNRLTLSEVIKKGGVGDRYHIEMNH